jgi:MraZ protein
MFKGRYIHTLDAKGRLSVPSRFREVLAQQHREETLILTNFGTCLAGFPLDEWELFEEKIRGLSMLQKDVQAFTRYFFSGAQECPVDKQGRILIPPTLREDAGLEKDVMLAGVANRIEVWSKPRWDAFYRESTESFESIAAKLAEFGF